jgi:hypothetical protein
MKMVVAMPLDVPEGDACEAQGDLIAFVPARSCAVDLEVAMDLDGAWSELPVSARQRVAALFDPSRTSAAASFKVVGCMPESFARDVARGGAGFRAAFPTLTRRIVGVIGGSPETSVRVECRGEHLGHFFDVLAPTKRAVQFDVTHRLVVGPNDRIEDHITLDLRTIVLQLARSTSRP